MAAPIIESRREIMVSGEREIMVSGEKEILRTANLICPGTTSIVDTPNPHLGGDQTSDHLRKPSLKVIFNGWNGPQEKWNDWIHSLQFAFEPEWKQAGIFDAIMGSKYKVEKHVDLILNLAERWSPATNTFIFPWGGEATITLEDVTMFGYSALGCPVLGPLETEEMKALGEKLEKGRKSFSKTSAKKASHGQWLNHFFGDMQPTFNFRRWCKEEHAAFLALWLSRFVIPGANDTVMKNSLPIAIRLASGNRIALAPALLASIYRDLTALKANLANNDVASSVTLNAPLQLVQVWAWERFTRLKPNPNTTQLGDHLLAKWHKVKPLKKVDISDRLLDAINNPEAEERLHFSLMRIIKDNDASVPLGFAPKNLQSNPKSSMKMNDCGVIGNANSNALPGIAVGNEREEERRKIDRIVAKFIYGKHSRKF